MEKKKEKKDIKNNKEEKIVSSISKETKDKIFKGIGVVVVVLAILGMAFWVSSSYGSGPYEFEEIKIDEYLKYLKDSKSRIIYLARPGCSWCQKEDPIIRSVGSKNKLKIYYLDATPFLSGIEDAPYTEDGLKLINSDEDWFKGEFGTPNTLIVKNGKIIDGVNGYVEKKQLEDLFERNGFM